MSVREKSNPLLALLLIFLCMLDGPSEAVSADVWSPNPGESVRIMQMVFLNIGFARDSNGITWEPGIHNSD